MDLDSDLPARNVDYIYIYSCSREIRFVGSQDVILESRPSLFGKAYPIKNMCLISLCLLVLAPVLFFY